MKCIRPVSIQDKETGNTMTVSCGRCINCRVNKSSEWTDRICAEATLHKDVYFCTLTYNDEHLPANGSLVKKHLQDFWKRLRKAVYPTKIRYYSVGEYGEQYNRPHYHFIIFGVCFEILNKVLPESWPCGFYRVDSFNVSTARYVSRYVTKKLTGDKSKLYSDRKIIPEFSTMSRKPGIGFGFLQENKDLIKLNKCVSIGRRKVPIPRYFYKKLDFTEEELQAQFEESRKSLTNKIKKNICQKNPNIFTCDNLSYVNLIAKSKIDAGKIYDFEREQARQQARQIKKDMELKKGKL